MGGRAIGFVELDLLQEGDREGLGAVDDPFSTLNGKAHLDEHGLSPVQGDVYLAIDGVKGPVHLVHVRRHLGGYDVPVGIDVEQRTHRSGTIPLVHRRHGDPHAGRHLEVDDDAVALRDDIDATDA
jgi:hypothetical protein